MDELIVKINKRTTKTTFHNLSPTLYNPWVALCEIIFHSSQETRHVVKKNIFGSWNKVTARMRPSESYLTLVQSHVSYLTTHWLKVIRRDQPQQTPLSPIEEIHINRKTSRQVFNSGPQEEYQVSQPVNLGIIDIMPLIPTTITTHGVVA